MPTDRYGRSFGQPVFTVMRPTTVAKFFAGRMHYAWVVLVVMFFAMLAGVGVRAAPGVMILPLERAFGWSVGTISTAVSINIILMGFTGPFLTGLVQVIGLKRTILGCVTLLAAGTGLSLLMSLPWQLFLTWGVMVGIGAASDEEVATSSLHLIDGVPRCPSQMTPAGAGAGSEQIPRRPGPE
jgi:MFS family permease